MRNALSVSKMLMVGIQFEKSFSPFFESVFVNFVVLLEKGIVICVSFESSIKGTDSKNSLFFFIVIKFNWLINKLVGNKVQTYSQNYSSKIIFDEFIKSNDE